MKKLIKHLKRWNIWRKRNCNSKFYKILVLLGLANSPTFAMTYDIEEKLDEWCQHGHDVEVTYRDDYEENA